MLFMKINEVIHTHILFKTRRNLLETATNPYKWRTTFGKVLGLTEKYSQGRYYKKNIYLFLNTRKMETRDPTKALAACKDTARSNWGWGGVGWGGGLLTPMFYGSPAPPWTAPISPPARGACVAPTLLISPHPGVRNFTPFWPTPHRAQLRRSVPGTTLEVASTVCEWCLTPPPPGGIPVPLSPALSQTGARGSGYIPMNCLYISYFSSAKDVLQEDSNKKWTH